MKLKHVLLSFLLFFIVELASAQCLCPGSPDDYTCDCPIDGGASLLVGAGIAYGMKKLRDNKKSKKDLKDTI